MSVYVSTWVWKYSRSEGNDRLVLLAIADAADEDGTNAWPAVGTLATKTRLSERTIQRCVKALAEMGELRVERNQGGRPGQRSDRRPNLYTVLMAQDVGGTDCHPAAGGVPDGVTDEPDGVTDDAPRGDTGDTQPVLDPPTDPPEGKNSSSDKPLANQETAERLCALLADLIEQNGSKRPKVTKAWLLAADRMIRIDGRSPVQIETVLRWSQQDGFWSSNILSMDKLREQYDRLRLRMNQPGRAGGNGSSQYTDAAQEALRRAQARRGREAQ
jgi:helix-turn-helix protein